jgi:hypothetical protein
MIKLERIKSAGHTGPMGKKKKPERKISLAITRSRWEDTLKIRVKEIGWEGVG